MVQLLTLSVRAILLVLSTWSFLPQLRRLHHRPNAAGLSITHTLLNLIVATEQLAFGLQLITVDPDLIYEGISHYPLTAGDWLNITQFLAVWLGHNAMYEALVARLSRRPVNDFALLTIDYSFFSILRTGPSRAGAKIAATVAYALFLLITLVPYLFELTLPPETKHSSSLHDRSWVAVWIGAIHSYLLTPPITLLAVLAFIPQARAIGHEGGPGALNLTGLGFQALVFAFVGVSWTFRLTIPREYWKMNPLRAMYTWHILVGWAAVYNIIFAVVQAALLAFAWSYEHSTKDESSGERMPLLQ